MNEWWAQQPDPPGLWYACEQPERHPDADTIWHIVNDCLKCRIKITALKQNDPLDAYTDWLADRVRGER